MACAKGSRDRQNNKGESGHPCLVPRCKGNEGEIILPVMTDAAGEWYNVLIIETKCSPKPNIAELPTYNSTLACQRLFLHQVKRPHKVLGGSPQSQEYEGVDAYCQMHCAPWWNQFGPPWSDCELPSPNEKQTL